MEMEIEREKEEKWRERGKERSFTHSSYPSFFHPCLLADVCVCVCGSGWEAGGHVLSEGRRSASWAISTEMIRAGRAVRGVATETGVREVEERILKDTWVKSSLLTHTQIWKITFPLHTHTHGATHFRESPSRAHHLHLYKWREEKRWEDMKARDELKKGTRWGWNKKRDEIK